MLTTDRFLQLLGSASPRLRRAYEAEVQAWAPDVIPATVAFAKIGEELVLTNADDVLKQALFDLIEAAFAEGSDELRTLVATGLLEAAIGQAYEVDGLWTQIGSRLGPLSAAHAEAWING